jgi:ABC-type Fe3+/spermidine/putrescine transport system ATPase subunit
MEPLRGKPVVELSGGQQQRVAVARALAVEPDVLLFDEPLSNLDVALREQTRVELKSLHEQLRTTSVYVTHDQSEALVLSDRIGVMREGELIEVGPPRRLYEQPQTAFVAAFLGGWNIIRAGELASNLDGQDLADGEAIAVRPDAIRITDDETGVRARIITRNYLGSRSELWLDVEGTRMRMFVEPDFQSDPDIRIQVRAGRRVRE